MTCKYNNWDGECELWLDDGMMFEHIINSCDAFGHCLVDEDEDPSESCEDYEEA